MKKVLTILSLILAGCGGEGNIINMRFPDSISALKMEMDYLLITSKVERKWLLITGEGKRVNSGKLNCIPVKNMSSWQKFLIFCGKEGELKTEIYVLEISSNAMRLTEEIEGIFTGSASCGEKICFTAYKDGKTKFYEMDGALKELFSNEGICTPVSPSYFICNGILYPDKIEIPEGGIIFPDQVSGPLLSSGREIKIVKNGRFLPFITMKNQPLSFLSFEEKMVFFDIAGYARVINRKTLEESSIFCGSYPVSATATGEERVYVLNELNPSITVINLKELKEIKTIW